MSDAPGGPSWWVAQNGKWYPPHLRPDVWADQSGGANAWAPVGAPGSPLSTSGSGADWVGDAPTVARRRHNPPSRSLWLLVTVALVVAAATATGVSLGLSGPASQASHRHLTSTTLVTAPALLDRASVTLEEARTVRVVAVVREPGDATLTSDFTYLSSGDISGEAQLISDPGPRLSLWYRQIGDDEYFDASAAMWVDDGYRPRVARSLAGRWVVAPVGALRDVVTFSLAELSNIISGLADEQPTIGPTRDVLGARAVSVRTSVGTLWVEPGPSARPIELAESDGSAVMKFLAWGGRPTFRRPAGAIRLPPI